MLGNKRTQLLTRFNLKPNQKITIDCSQNAEGPIYYGVLHKASMKEAQSSCSRKGFCKGIIGAASITLEI